MSRARAAAYWAAPPLFALILYWQGLFTWFHQDDFHWLGLTSQIHSPADFWRVLFAPMAQGTIRPLSDRAFFMGFYTLFGLDALPFRVWVFLTQFANFALLSAVTQRVTGSRAAGFWAPVLWIANTALVRVMAWNSVYNQALCAFFLLLAFYFFLRHIETGRRRDYVLQWVAFLVGFGALEINVVYPAIAATYAMLRAPAHLRKTLPLFIPSAIFAIVHRMVAPKEVVLPYGMYFDASIFASLWQYILWALGPTRLATVLEIPPWIGAACTALLAAGLGVFVWARLRKRDWTPLFCLGWFALTLTPVLPLRDHVSEYYLTLPTIGLAMLGGWAVAQAWKAGPAARSAAVALVLIYGSTSIYYIHVAIKWRHDLSRSIERVMDGVAEARRLHPRQTILLHEVDGEVFWNGLLDRPFRLIGIQHVYLTPESETSIKAYPELGSVSDFVLPVSSVLAGLSDGLVTVYSARGERLKNITRAYEQSVRLQLKAEMPRRVDAGDPLAGRLLGRTWHQPDGGHRWMPGRATVRIGGPRAAGERLHISFVCPEASLAKGPVKLTLHVDGQKLPVSTIHPGNQRFDLQFELPEALVGRESIEIAIEVDRTITPTFDGRELGLAFGIFEIR